MDIKNSDAKFNLRSTLADVGFEVDILSHVYTLIHAKDFEVPIIERPTQDLVQLSYKERKRLIKIFSHYDALCSQGREDKTHYGSVFLLFATMPYPQSMMSHDKMRVEDLLKDASACVDPLARALKDKNGTSLLGEFTKVCRDFTGNSLGAMIENRLDVYPYEKEFDPVIEQVETAVFRARKNALTIGFNVSSDAFEKSIYYKSGEEAVCVALHEYTHLEQQYRFIERSPATLIEKYITSRPSGNFIEVGHRFYDLPEVNLLSYLANSTERQARFRQYMMLDRLAGRPLKSEREYFEGYVWQHLSAPLKKKMTELKVCA